MTHDLKAIPCDAGTLGGRYSLVQAISGSWSIKSPEGFVIWSCGACTANEAIERAEFDGFEFDQGFLYIHGRA
ncbi:MAG: hypothetical protein KGL39_27465 [Patescibacteria group bacterium]|nr:hypothetical protein [Patescibacteria group bacterium]